MAQISRQSVYSQEKAERIEVRLSKSQKELIQHAAESQGRSITDFVINCANNEAIKIIREHEIIALTTKNSERFVDTLLNAPKPNAALRKAAKRYKNFTQSKD